MAPEAFDLTETDELVVPAADHRPLGVVSEAFAVRRYATTSKRCAET
jgi:hypothetical protein